MLIGDQGRLGNDNFFLRGAALEIDPHQLTVDQAVLRIGYCGPDGDGVGRLIHGHVDEVYLTHLVVDRSIRKSNSCLDALDIGRWAALRSTQEFTLAHRENHIHRILADYCREDTALGADDIALRQRRAPDLAGNRRNNVSVAEIDLRCPQIGLIGQHLPLLRSLQRNGFVQFLFGGHAL